jgi:hypothetical protein
MKPEIQDKLRKILIKGHGVRPLTLRVYGNTIHFLERLPDDIPVPDLELEPNGHLMMVWRNNDYFKGYVMLKTNDSKNKSVHMLYAKPGNFDVSFHYFENSIPKEILTAIREIMKK